MTLTTHLTDIASLEADIFIRLIDRALDLRTAIDAGHWPEPVLRDRMLINVFFETSTRTTMSFDIAARRLGAHALTLPVATSSVRKGESLGDTVLTLAAQGADFLVIRAAEPGSIDTAIAALTQDGFPTSVINGGEGALGHPTQGLLDAATVLRALDRRARRGLADTAITICGDIRHSRVAASAIEAFSRLSAEIRLTGPFELLPDPAPRGVALVTPDLEEALHGADFVMALRLQKERMGSHVGLTDAGFHAQYGLSHAVLARAAPKARIMHPGPVNRGIEITDALADDPERSLIRDQVRMGLALRMAVLEWLAEARH